MINQPFAKALWILETWKEVNNNWCGKWVSLLELPTSFDERFEVTSVPSFISDFNLISYELDNFTVKVLYCGGCNHLLFGDPFEELETDHS